MNLIEKNEFYYARDIGKALAENGGGEEAKEITMNLIEKNEFYYARGVEEALKIAMKNRFIGRRSLVIDELKSTARSL